MSCPFTRLPAELLRPIFAFAAFESRKTAYDLCLVAQWVSSIARPALYRIVILKSPKLVTGALETIERHSNTAAETSGGRREHSHSPSQLNVHVRHVWMSCEGQGTFEQFLLLCPNVEDLAIGTKYPERMLSSLGADGEGEDNFQYLREVTNSDMPLIEAKIKRLTITTHVGTNNWEDMIRDPAARRFLAQLTHLILHKTAESINCPLTELHNLTHFAMPFAVHNYQYNVQTAIARGEVYNPFELPASLLVDVRERFQMFVLLYSPAQLRQRWGPEWRNSVVLRRWITGVNSTDARLYFIPFEGGQDRTARKWEDEARGKKTIWDEAAELLLQMQLASLAVTGGKSLR